jgi:hypothetical protein
MSENGNENKNIYLNKNNSNTNTDCGILSNPCKYISLLFYLLFLFNLPLHLFYLLLLTGYLIK